LFLHSEKQNNWQTITGHKFRRSQKFRMTPEQRFPKNTNPVQHKRVTSLPSLTSIFQRTELNRSMINGWRRRSAVQIYTEILFCTSSTTCNVGLHEVCGNVLTIAIQWISNEQVIRDFVFIYKVTLFRKFATINLVWDSQKLTNTNSLDNVYNKNYHAGIFLCHIPLLCKRNWCVLQNSKTNRNKSSVSSKLVFFPHMFPWLVPIIVGISVRHGDAGDAFASLTLKIWPLFGQKFSKFGQIIQLHSHVSR